MWNRGIREISRLNRTTPSHNQHVNLIGEGSLLVFSMRTHYINTFILVATQLNIETTVHRDHGPKRPRSIETMVLKDHGP